MQYAVQNKQQYKEYECNQTLLMLPLANAYIGAVVILEFGKGLAIYGNEQYIIHIENIKYGTTAHITAAIRSQSGAGSVLQGIG